MSRLFKISFIFLNVLFFSIASDHFLSNRNLIATTTYALTFSFFVIIFGGLDKGKTIRRYEFVSVFALSFAIATLSQVASNLIYKVPVSYRYFLILAPFSIIVMPALVSLMYSHVLAKYKVVNILSLGDTVSSGYLILGLTDIYLHKISSVYYMSIEKFKSVDSSFIQEKGINMILACKPEDSLYRLSKHLKIPLFSVGRMYEDYFRKIPLDIIKKNESFYTISFEDKGIDPLVRLLDILLSILILIITSPIIFVSAILLMIFESDEIVFVQDRIGYLERTFRMYKLSTMKYDMQTKAYRVTNLGSLLRKMRINELPQLWNVLKGDMSLVGPRPDLKIEYDLFNQEIPYYHYRLNTLPGITGHAQVYFDYVELLDVAETEKRLEFDLYYVKNYSVYLYLMTILKSIGTVLFMKGK